MSSCYRVSQCAFKTVGAMVGDRPAKPRKTAHYFRYMDTENRLLRDNLFPKALPAYVFDPKPSMRLELMTSSLPMKCSTTEL
jgi:hypothetical protein